MAIESDVSTGKPDEMPEPDMQEHDESGEGETMPMSLLEGKQPKPGDVISPRIKILSVDEDNGVFEGQCVGAEKSGGAIDRAAGEYDKMPGMNKGAM